MSENPVSKEIEQALRNGFAPPPLPVITTQRWQGRKHATLCLSSEHETEVVATFSSEAASMRFSEAFNARVSWAFQMGKLFADRQRRG